MAWLFVAITAHLINGLTFVMTKVLLEKCFKSATILVILIGILGMGVFVLAPFGILRPTVFELIIDLVAGGIFIGALLLFNYTLKNFEITRVVPIVGGAVPAFTWLLAFLILGEELTKNEIIAFFLLVVGTIFVANVSGRTKGNFSIPMIVFSLGAGLFFASHFVLSKYIFETQEFLNGFIWIRLGSFIAAIVLILFPQNRKALSRFIALPIKNFKLSLAVAAGFGLSGFLLLNYAVASGSVTLTNALQGVQYAFLLIITVIISKFFPKVLNEKYSAKIIFQKFVGILFISGAIVLLSF